VDVPFLFWSQGSRPTPRGVAVCAVGGVSSGLSPTAVRQLTSQDKKGAASNKLFCFKLFF